MSCDSKRDGWSGNRAIWQPDLVDPMTAERHASDGHGYKVSSRAAEQPCHFAAFGSQACKISGQWCLNKRHRPEESRTLHLGKRGTVWFPWCISAGLESLDFLPCFVAQRKWLLAPQHDTILLHQPRFSAGTVSERAIATMHTLPVRKNLVEVFCEENRDALHSGSAVVVIKWLCRSLGGPGTTS